MNFDKLFIRYLVDNDLTVFYETSSLMKPIFLRVEYRSSLSFLTEYVENYEILPDRSTLESFAGIIYDEPAVEPGKFYIDALTHRYLLESNDIEIQRLKDLNNKGNPELVVHRMEEYALNYRETLINEDVVTSIFDSKEEFRKEYEDIKAGVFRGVELPWETINNALVGYQKGDFIVFVARTAIGKTFCVLYQADYAFLNKKRVLFITPELTAKRLLMRLVAVHFKIPYDALRKGMLGTMMEKKFWSDLDDLAKMSKDEFLIMGKGMRMDASSVRAAIFKSKPDIVFIDSFYKLNPLQSGIKDRFEKAAILSEELKEMAIDFDVPIIGTTQFNRNVQGKKLSEAASVENIALADAIGWNIDFGFALLRDEDLRIDKRMIVRAIKTRESEHINDVVIHWDFDNMNFDEIGTLASIGKLSSLMPTSRRLVTTSTGGVVMAGMSDDDSDIPF